MTDKEILYSAVRRSIPDSFVDGVPMPSLFIDPRGASFSRDGERQEIEIVEALSSKILKDYKPDMIGCVRISAANCRTAETLPVSRPTKTDPYHAEVYDSEKEKQLSLKKAMLLCDLCQVVEIEDRKDDQDDPILQT